PARRRQQGRLLFFVGRQEKITFRNRSHPAFRFFRPDRMPGRDCPGNNSRFLPTDPLQFSFLSFAPFSRLTSPCQIGLLSCSSALSRGSPNFYRFLPRAIC